MTPFFSHIRLVHVFQTCCQAMSFYFLLFVNCSVSSKLKSFWTKDIFKNYLWSTIFYFRYWLSFSGHHVVVGFEMWTTKGAVFQILDNIIYIHVLYFLLFDWYIFISCCCHFWLIPSLEAKTKQGHNVHRNVSLFILANIQYLPTLNRRPISGLHLHELYLVKGKHWFTSLFIATLIVEADALNNYLLILTWLSFLSYYFFYSCKNSRREKDNNRRKSSAAGF